MRLVSSGAKFAANTRRCLGQTQKWRGLGGCLPQTNAAVTLPANYWFKLGEVLRGQFDNVPHRFNCRTLTRNMAISSKNAKAGIIETVFCVGCSDRREFKDGVALGT
jgi:hypothetical protein